MRPSGFIKPCLPSKVSRPPSGALWVHEIKHDGYRLMVRRDGSRVRLFTRNGHDWADRFPSIVDAVQHFLKAQSFLIDGEAVIARDDGTPDFHALRNRRRGREAALYAFDLIGHDGDDLRDLPLVERKRRLAKNCSVGLNGVPSSSLSIWQATADCVRACLPDGVGGHRVEADRCALSERAVKGVVQVEEPGERGGQTGTRGGVALTSPGQLHLSSPGGISSGCNRYRKG